jgi:DNA modification methylase
MIDNQEFLTWLANQQKQIKIKCKGAGSLKLEEFQIIQGNLKEITDSNLIKLIKSIIELGFIAPIFIWNKEILDGSHRLKALFFLEGQGFPIPEIPVVYITAKNKIEAKKILLVISSHYADWNMEEVSEWIMQIGDGISDIIRIQDYTISDDTEIKQDENINETNQDDEISEEVENITQVGDVWQLGRHKVLCGDSTILKDLQNLFGNTRANMLLTDPPYNRDYTGKTKDKLKIQNDIFTDSDFLIFLVNAFSNAKCNMNEAAAFYIFHADLEGLNFRLACKNSGLTVRQCLIWNKNSLVIGHQDYQWKHEPILYGWKEGSAHNWYNDRKQVTVIDHQRPSKSENHPTMKPVDLLIYFIMNSSKTNDIILDSFLGSGSTLIACEKTNRVCYGIEIDCHYCDIIIARYTKWCISNNKIPIIKHNNKDFDYSIFKA